jgi:hypothetical protein
MDGRRKRSERRAVATRRPGLAAEPSQRTDGDFGRVCASGGDLCDVMGRDERRRYEFASEERDDPNAGRGNDCTLMLRMCPVGVPGVVR